MAFAHKFLYTANRSLGKSDKVSSTLNRQSSLVNFIFRNPLRSSSENLRARIMREKEKEAGEKSKAGMIYLIRATPTGGKELYLRDLCDLPTK